MSAVEHLVADVVALEEMAPMIAMIAEGVAVLALALPLAVAEMAADEISAAVASVFNSSASSAQDGVGAVLADVSAFGRRLASTATAYAATEAASGAVL